MSHQLRQLRDRRVVVRGKRGRVDAEQTQACRYLSIVVLAGIGLNALFGREAWAGEHDHA